MLCIVVQEHIPHYRIPFFTELNKNVQDLLVLHSSALTSDGKVENLNFPFKNSFVKKTIFFKFVWQSVFYILWKNKPRYIVLGLEIRKFSNLFIWLVSFLLGSKIIWWTHGFNVHLKKTSFLYVIDRLFKVIAMKFSHKIILYTDYNKYELVKYGINEDKIVVINNAIDCFEYKKCYDEVSCNEIRCVVSKTKISNHTLTFLGRLTARKKPYLIIQLALDLIKIYPDLRVFVIGDGEEFGNLKSLIAQNSLEDFVFMVGSINDPARLAPYMRLTDFVVLPGSVGLSIVHSFIYGIPFLTLKDQSHSPEISYLKNEDNGYMASSIEDLSLWLVNNFDNFPKRHFMSSNCLLLSKNININNMVSNFIKIFDDLNSYEP